MCSYITYSIEPGVTETLPINPSTEEITSAPEPVPATMPASPSEEVSNSVSHPSIDEQLNKAKKQEASDFNKEIEAIILKQINSFFKNGGKGTIGIFIKELKTGFEYAYNAEKTNPDNPMEGYFNSASTCKLLSAAVMYYMNKCGELELDKTYTDEITKSQYNLRKLLPRMISHSVNDYFNITLRHLGPVQINDTLLKLGLKNSLVYSEIMPAQYSSVSNNIKRYGISRSPRTTPKDLGCVLDLLYAGKTFGAENHKLFMESLLNNIYSNRLPAGVDYKSPVAHKTGTSSGEGVYNDAGIVFLEGNPYIIVVMCKGSSSSVQSLYRTIAMKVYNYMKKRTESQS
jgi:beta-lactamase class A